MSTQEQKIVESIDRLAAKKGDAYVRGLLDGLEIGTADATPAPKEE